MGESVNFVGVEQGIKNCINNSPVGCIINASKNFEEMVSAFQEGDYGKVAGKALQNLKNSSPLYSCSIFGTIDNFFD